MGHLEKIAKGGLKRAIIQGVKHLRRPEHEWREKEPIKKFTGLAKRREGLIHLLWLCGVKGPASASFFNLRDYGWGAALLQRKLLAIVLFNGHGGIVRWPSWREGPILFELKRSIVLTESKINSFAVHNLSVSNTDDIDRFMDWIESFDVELINVD